MPRPKHNDLSALKARAENAIKRQPYQSYVYVEPRILLMLIEAKREQTDELALLDRIIALHQAAKGA